MNAEIFSDLLRIKLSDLSMSEEVINSSVERFYRAFSGKTNDEIDTIISSMGGIDAIVSNISVLLPANPAETVKPVLLDCPVEDTISAKSADPTEEFRYPVSPDVTAPVNPESLQGNEPARSHTGFWVAFALTLPLTFPLFLAATVTIFALIFAVMVLIGALFISLFAIVISGSALSLIGVIYGTVKLFDTLPIGLFELALGIVIGGLTMLSGILIYNFTVRFLPFVFKKLVRLYNFMNKKTAAFLKSHRMGAAL